MSPRDYKSPSRRTSRRQGPGGWPWFAAGVLVGVLATLVITWQDVFTAGDVASAMRKAASGSAVGPAPQVSPEKQGKAQRPRFEFYTMLPEMEIAVPEQELAEAASTESRDPSGEFTYVLQVGSFRKPQEADRLKAELALIGMQTQIQTVAIDGENKWHRVRVGPFTNLQALNEARDALKRQGVEAMVLKIKL